MLEEITVRKYLELLFGHLKVFSGESYERLSEEYNRYLKERKPASPEAKAVLDSLVKTAAVPEKLAALLELNIKELEELELLDIAVTAEILGLPVSQVVIPADKKPRTRLLHTNNRSVGSVTLRVIRAIISDKGQSAKAIEKKVFGTTGDKKSATKVGNVKHFLLRKFAQSAKDLDKVLGELLMSDVISCWLPAVTEEQTQLYQEMITKFGGMQASVFVSDYLFFQKEGAKTSVPQTGAITLGSVVETILGNKFCQPNSSDFLVPIIGGDVGDFLIRNGINKSKSWKDALVMSFNRAKEANGDQVSEEDCLKAQNNIIAALKNGGVSFIVDENAVNTRFFMSMIKILSPDCRTRLEDFLFPSGGVSVDLCSRLVFVKAELNGTGK